MKKWGRAVLPEDEGEDEDLPFVGEEALYFDYLIVFDDAARWATGKRRGVPVGEDEDAAKLTPRGLARLEELRAQLGASGRKT